jgi:quercetin dioxygenase-like cupin family protein
MRQMNRLVVLLALASATPIAAQGTAPIRCVADSPERTGGTGCSILAHKEIPVDGQQPLYWHIDKFPSLRAATAAATSSAVAAEAHGSAWLMILEPQTSDHHGGAHVATVGPLPLPPVPRLMMQIMSAHFVPGQITEPHTHSGPEAWFVVEGEQCLETPDRAVRVKAGETAMIKGGPSMRLVGTGTHSRRALALILHDAAQPATTITRGVKLVSCS